MEEGPLEPEGFEGRMIEGQPPNGKGTGGRKKRRKRRTRRTRDDWKAVPKTGDEEGVEGVGSQVSRGMMRYEGQVSPAIVLIHDDHLINPNGRTYTYNNIYIYILYTHPYIYIYTFI